MRALAVLAHAVDPTDGGFPNFDPYWDVLALGAVVIAGYVMAGRWYRARMGVPAFTRFQATVLGGALAAFAVAALYPIHALSETRLFSVHMLQHSVFSLILAPLLVIGTPAWLAREFLERTRLLGFVRFWARFFPATILFNLVLVVTHVPIYVNTVVGNSWLHALTHALIVVTGLVVWMPVLSPLPEVPRIEGPVGMLYLFLQSIVPTIPASFLTFGAKPLYHFYEDLPRIWGVSALNDMQMAGLVMKILNGLFTWVVIAIVFFRWYEAEESGVKPRRRTRQADRELDRELTALGLADS